ncbi:PNG1 with de-n-glycosylation function (n-glycanase) [Apiospora saccharicola]
MIFKTIIRALDAVLNISPPPANDRQNIGPPEESCGREIITTQLRGLKKAWYALGAALEIFERDIEPRISAAPETSRPTIVVCCEVPQVRDEVESSIRQHGILNQYPEFGLQTSSQLLELAAPLRTLSGNQQMRSSPVPNDTIAPEAPLGRRIATLDEKGRHQFSTGGIVLQGVVFQGDCGSVVLEQDTGAFYGHIVRGRPNTGIAYIIAAGDIFRDIKERLGKEPVIIARPLEHGAILLILSHIPTLLPVMAIIAMIYLTALALLPMLSDQAAAIIRYANNHIILAGHKMS